MPALPALGHANLRLGPHLDAHRLQVTAQRAGSLDTVTIDLSDASFVTPYGLVFIAVHAEHISRAGRRPLVIAPHDPHVARYIARMKLGGVIEGLGGTHDLPAVRHHDVGDRLLELQRVSDSARTDALAENVHDRLHPADRRAASAMHQSICEIGQNVFQHSGQPHGYIAAQSYDGNRVSFAIGDGGVGLRRSLEPFRHFTDDLDVIDAVLHGGVTSTGKAGRGHGIAHTRGLIAARGGTLTVHTEETVRTVSSSHQTLARRPMSGTLICGDINTQ
ncbi:sensor histidine kinase [Aeromicrobium piscarium]|uniref:Sensor histidine kinase n=1 Tax=Aeromicrobium piscarium TaxID=2590901 RepID=A0A554S738_9ACTN|nr:sensor histidine kinase [Aeromicrobium piscarium]TSD62173.1 sensor histidine kinase [Aeromicrobium piscarium]